MGFIKPVAPAPVAGAHVVLPGQTRWAVLGVPVRARPVLGTLLTRGWPLKPSPPFRRMRLGQIFAPGIPLGPFAKSPLAFFAPASSIGLLHGERECGRLRSAAAVVSRVERLESALGRLCRHCAWPIPEGDPLVGFVDTVSVLSTRASRRANADAPGPGNPASREEACRQWRQRQGRLLRCAPLVAAYPWLRPWADPSLERLASQVEEARRAFAALIDPVALLESACAALLPEPHLVDGVLLATLGSDAEWLTQEAWVRWQYACLDGWDGPSAAAPAATAVFHEAFGPRRRGRARTLEAVGMMTTRWAATATEAARRQRDAPGRTVTVRVPPVETADADALDGTALSRWESAVVATCQTSADWTTGTLRLNCPEAVTSRLTTLTATAPTQQSPH